MLYQLVGHPPKEFDCSRAGLWSMHRKKTGEKTVDVAIDLTICQHQPWDEMVSPTIGVLTP